LPMGCRDRRGTSPSRTDLPSSCSGTWTRSPRRSSCRCRRSPGRRSGRPRRGWTTRRPGRSISWCSHVCPPHQPLGATVQALACRTEEPHAVVVVTDSSAGARSIRPRPTWPRLCGVWRWKNHGGGASNHFTPSRSAVRHSLDRVHPGHDLTAIPAAAATVTNDSTT
jgi:hypothetical protein